MKRIFNATFFLIFVFAVFQANGATWEKLYSAKGPDCFRNVHELSGGGYIVTGYTNNLNDTDGLVIRMDDDGDSLWAFVYDGPSGSDDIFLKGIQTSDGGFIICGYSSSFGAHENALYIKLNSSGQLQWVKNWGGSGYDRAKDIVQLPDGKYVLVGYTNSSPAQSYDAFILKVDASGNTIWSRIYGGATDDEANSMQLLPDGGFIMGGEGDEDLFIVRTDAGGNLVWSNYIGTSGVEVLKALVIAPDGNGFALSGTTTGVGAGGEDAYLVRTDSGGSMLWSKNYGGPLDDGFQGLNTTSDGNYIGIGTSRLGPWPDPNIWLFKLDVNGNILWQNYFGGDEHDHGYTASETSDGGFIVGGHTHSFADNINLEDAILIKTNSTGQVNSPLNYTTVTDIISPESATCGTANLQVVLQIANYSVLSVANIPVTVEISGAINQTLTQTYPSSVSRNSVKTLTFSTLINMSAAGTYYFHCYTGNPHDVYPPHNFLDKTIVINSTVTSAPSVSGGSHCGPGTVDVTATSSHQIKWYDVATGGTSLFTGALFTTPYLSSTGTFYAEAGTTCPSARVPATATITGGLTLPTATGSSRCGPGSVTLTASSSYSLKWYDSHNSTTSLFTGSSFVTPVLNADENYYVAAENATCASQRVQVNAVIIQLPDPPVISGGLRCGPGTVMFNATAASSVNWFDHASGGNMVGSGNNFVTPFLNSSTTYYVQSDDGTCMSNRIPAVATINYIPSPPATIPGAVCDIGMVNLQAVSSDSVLWYDASSGGNNVGSGSTFTTQLISHTTTFYAASNNHGCESARVPVEAVVDSIPMNPFVTSAERCGEGTVVMTATAFVQIEWRDAISGGNIVGVGNSFTTPVISASTIYYAFAVNGSCSSAGIIAEATINPSPIVNFGSDTIYSSQNPYLLDAGSGFASYQWSTSNTAQTQSVDVAGNFCVTVSDAIGCTSTSCVFIDFETSVDEKTSDEILLFPNPSNGIISITNTGVPKLVFSVFNITGETVYSRKLNFSNERIDLSFLSDGIYMAQFSNEENYNFKRKIVIN